MRILLAVLLILTGLTLQVKAQQFFFRNFNVSEGLAQSQVSCMLQDRQGYIWLGTRGGGLCRFDGTNFKTFTIHDGLASNFIMTIQPDAKGNLWIGTHKGITYFDGSAFKKMVIDAKEPDLGITSMAGTTGFPVFASRKGIHQFNGKKIITLYPLNIKGNEVVTGLYVRNNEIIYTDDTGLHLVSNGNTTTFSKENGLKNTYVRSLSVTDNGNIFIGTYGGGIYEWKENNFSAFSFSPAENEKLKVIQSSFIDSHHNLWLGTIESGCCKINLENKSIRFYDKSNGLCSNNIISFTEDRWGNIWIGSSGEGFSIFSDEAISNYNNTSSVKGSYIYRVFCAPDSSVWISTNVRGIQIWKNGTSKHITQPELLGKSKIRCINRDTSGIYWLGTDGNGLWKYDGNDFIHYGAGKIGSNWVREIVCDTGNVLWLATSGGGIQQLMHQNGELIFVRKIRKRDGLLSDRINSIIKDNKGRLWYGTDGSGMGYIDSTGIHNISIAQGLPNNTIRYFTKDAQGKIYCATAEGILSIEENGGKTRFTTINITNNLLSDNIYFIVFDKTGKLWAGHEKGIDRIHFTNGKPTDVFHLTRENGFTGSETVVGSCSMDTEGNLWLGTINGLFRVSPHLFQMATNDPAVVLDKVSLFYKNIDQTGYSGTLNSRGVQQYVPVFGYNENHLGFDFNVIYPHRPSAVKYRWKLQGFDQRWSPYEKKLSATYSNLPPGKYIFLVRTYNEDTRNENEFKLYEFEIDQPYWQTSWFKILMGALIIFLITAVFIIYTIFTRRRHKRMQEKLQLENNILQLQQQALRLQMNPHFIFHCLNSIQNLIMKKDETTAREYITKFSRLMRNMVESGRKENITLAQEIESLKNYLEIEQFTRDHTFEFKIVLNPDLETDLIKLPPLLLQPIVENSLIHGFNGIDYTGEIKIVFEDKGNELLITVTDNGIGINAARAKEMRPGHESMAFKITKERLAHFSPDGREATVEIHDRTEHEGVNGTRTIIRIPL